VTGPSSYDRVLKYHDTRFKATITTRLQSLGRCKVLYSELLVRIPHPFYSPPPSSSIEPEVPLSARDEVVCPPSSPPRHLNTQVACQVLLLPREVLLGEWSPPARWLAICLSRCHRRRDQSRWSPCFVSFSCTHFLFTFRILN